MSQQKALIYCRVSSERQKNEGHGLDSQEQRCRIYCEQKGYEAEKAFKDSFSGGGDYMQRPAMKELLGYADAHPHKNYVVVFDDLKRFARDTSFHIKLRQEFKARQMRVECPNFTFEDTPEGEFVETILAAQGQLERQQNRRQVIQKMKARLDMGYWPFYPPPGYRSEKKAGHGKVLEPYEQESILISQALEGFATNRFLNKIDIQKFLQQEKYGGGKKIYLQFVERLLNRIPIYAGFIEYPDWEVSRRMGHHKALIDREVFTTLERKLSGKPPLRGRKDQREDFPLRHTMVVCSKCLHPLTASYTTKKRRPEYKQPYYRCSNFQCEERKKSIRRDIIEPRFETILKEIKPKPLVLKMSEMILLDLWEKKMASLVLKERREIQEQSKLQGEIKKLVERIKKANNERVIREYEKQIEDLSRQEEKAQEKADLYKQPKIDFGTALRLVFAYFENPYLRWKSGDLEEKTMVMNLVFQDVIPYDRENGFGTAPLSLPLRVFEHFTVSKVQGVEMGGVEPPSKDENRKPSTSVSFDKLRTRS